MSGKTGKILGGIALAPFVLIALGVAYCEANKAYWDHQVKLMCEKDGGVTVFEKVYLTKEDRKNIRVRNIKNETKDEIYYSEFNSETIRNGNPKLLKNEYFLYRTSDNKMLGKQIDYARIGGDIPTGILHPSSFSCDKAGVSTEIQNAIFIIKEN